MCTVLFLQLFSSRCLILRSTQCKKAEKLSLFHGLTPSFDAMFHVSCFFSTSEDVTEIIDCKSLKISQENFYDEVSFSKVASLQCSDCNFAIKRTRHRFLLEYVPKNSCLKNSKKRKSIFFPEKSLWWTSILIKLQPCSEQPLILSKSGAYVRPSCRSAVEAIFTGKPP